MKRSEDDVRSKTIQDFGEQWTSYTENLGYYGSTELLADFFGPLLGLNSVADKRTADIGSGTGRIVNMLLDAGAAHVIAVEPSAAYSILRENTAGRSARITYINDTGDSLPPDASLDLIVSMGVLHHIPDPAPVASAALSALRPGGTFFVWLYGCEGNELYLRLTLPLRSVTTRVSHKSLVRASKGLNVLLDLYLFLCRYVPLPMRKYMNEVLARLPRKARELTIYDQLNPAYAKYYTQEESENLLKTAGFVNVRSWHRHGYSWSVCGERPA